MEHIEYLTAILNIPHCDFSLQCDLPICQEPATENVFLDELPMDILENIFSYLELHELMSVSISCKNWNRATSLDLQKKALLKKIAFGVEEWNKYFGDIGEAPLLPYDIFDILKSHSHYWPSKRIWQTHTLTLIPKCVNGELLTLNLLRELVSHPNNGGFTAKYNDPYDNDLVKREFGDKDLAGSCWVLFTRKAIKSSTEEDKFNFVIAREFLGGNYFMPISLIAATNILVHYVKTGIYFDLDVFPYDFIHCMDSVSNNHPFLISHMGEDGSISIGTAYRSTSAGLYGMQIL